MTSVNHKNSLERVSLPELIIMSRKNKLTETFKLMNNRLEELLIG